MQRRVFKEVLNFNNQSLQWTLIVLCCFIFLKISSLRNRLLELENSEVEFFFKTKKDLNRKIWVIYFLGFIQIITTILNAFWGFPIQIKNAFLITFFAITFLILIDLLNSVLILKKFIKKTNFRYPILILELILLYENRYYLLNKLKMFLRRLCVVILKHTKQ